MFAWVRRWLNGRHSDSGNPAVGAAEGSVAVGRDNINSPITIGLDEEGVRRVLRDEIPGLAKAKGVPEAPLRAVLKKLGEKRVPKAEIPARLAAAADELIRLRDDLTRLRNDRPGFATIRARAAALIDRGEFDAARATLHDGRLAARALREEISRSEAGFLADEARIDRLQLNYDAACENFAEAARLDPGNCWIWIELGDLWTLRGSLAEAERAFRAALKAAGCGDDRNLAVSHERIGDVQSAQGDLAAALTSYQASHDIFERLAKADPGNAGWQRDLSVSHNKIGDVQSAQGDLAAALTSYQASLAIRDRLTKADPGNAGWQRDLALSYGRVAMVGARLGARDDALGAFRRGRDIVAHLVRRSPDNATLPKDLAWFDAAIATLDE